MTAKQIWGTLRNSLKALRNGEFLLRIRADKYYIHIMYLFVLIWAGIFLSLKVEKTLTREVENKAALEELRIRHSQKEAELVKLRSASSCEERLSKMGSEATMPKEPATRIRK